MADLRVYIASPYTVGDVGMNLHSHMRIFDELSYIPGIMPVAPLWAHIQHLSFPRPYEFWIGYSLKLAELCDVCLRVGAKIYEPLYEQSVSKGADEEVAFFLKKKRPVFYTTEAFYEWLRTDKPHLP